MKRKKSTSEYRSRKLDKVEIECNYTRVSTKPIIRVTTQAGVLT